MKQEVKITDESGNVQQCAVMRGCFMEGKSASLGLALLYATGNEGKLYVMDADFVKALLTDINNVSVLDKAQIDSKMSVKIKWIKITDENTPDADTKIAFLTDHILFPDNAYFGIRSDVTGDYYSNGQIFEKKMVTHYFYVA